MHLQPDDHILFFGDSITDAGRRDPENHNNHMGHGYASMCAARLAVDYPEMNLRFTNTGTSGNRVYDLADRLQRDVLDRAPTVVSILIGINDTWRRYDSDVLSPIDEFRDCLEGMLAKIVPAVRMVLLLEPFLLPTPPDRVAWREDLDPRIGAIRNLARQFRTVFVPLDGVFAAAACRQPMEHWLPDGVHPTPAGHALIADHWLAAVGAR